MERERRRLAPRLLSALGAVLAAALLAELAARAWFLGHGVPWSAVHARERVARMEREVGGRLGWEGESGTTYDNLVLQPYYGYDSANFQRGKERLVEALREKHDGELSVLLVGGSVAALFNGLGGGGSDELARLIEADPRAGGRKVHVVGLARPGFKQPQQLHEIADLLRQGAVPDVVLNLDGYNELELAVGNLRHGLPADWPSHAHWLHVSSAPGRGEEVDQLVASEVERRAFAADAERVAASPLLHSALLGHSQMAHLAKRQAEAQAAAAQALALRAADRAAEPLDLDQALPAAVDVWARSSLLLGRMCAVSGVRYVHALHPTLHDRGSKPLTAEEERDGLRGEGFKESVLRGYPLLRAAGAELSAQGERFCDASDVFQDVTETLYYDPCHFTPDGNRILAARLAEAVLGALE